MAITCAVVGFRELCIRKGDHVAFMLPILSRIHLDDLGPDRAPVQHDGSLSGTIMKAEGASGRLRPAGSRRTERRVPRCVQSSSKELVPRQSCVSLLWQKLHRFVGRGKALEWRLLGSHVTATEALTHGLVTGIHSAVDLIPAAMELASRFRLLGPRAVAQSKLAVRMCGDTDLATAKNVGFEALAMLIGAAEWQKGMNALMEKREPRFPPRGRAR